MVVEIFAIYAYVNDELSVLSFSGISLSMALLICMQIIIHRNKVSKDSDKSDI